MAKKKNKNRGGGGEPQSSGGGAPVAEQNFGTTQQAFQLDLDERRRQFDVQNAQFIAQQMYARLKTEMETRGYMVEPERDASGNWTGNFRPIMDANGQTLPTINASQQARDLALREAQFEFEKERQAWNENFQERDQQFQQWLETGKLDIDNKRLGIQEAGITGFYNGQATLDQRKWLSDATGYIDNGQGGQQATLERERYELDSRIREAQLTGDYQGMATLEKQRMLLDQAIREGDLTGNYNGQATLEYQKYKSDEALRMAQLTGYVPGTGGPGGQGGQATLEREQFLANASGYMPGGQATLAREQMQQGQIRDLLNAPRGPADFAAYMNRVRGMNTQGMAPGAVGQFLQGQQINQYSNAGGAPVPVTSNTDLYMAALQSAQGRPSGPNGVPIGQPMPGQQEMVAYGQGQPGLPGYSAYGGAPMGGGQTGGQMNQGALASAIYGQGLQGVGSFNIDQMDNASWNGWLNNLRSQGSGANDPRISQIANVARQSGYDMSQYDQWAGNPPQVVNGGQPGGRQGTMYARNPLDGGGNLSGRYRGGPLPPTTPWYGPGGSQSQVQQGPRYLGPPVTRGGIQSREDASKMAADGGIYGSSPYGQTSEQQAVQRMFGSVFQPMERPSVKSGDQYSYQQFRKLSPTEQEYTTGLAEEYGNQTRDDFLSGMKRAAPSFAGSRRGRMSGIS